jgi:hypothetical protein
VLLLEVSEDVCRGMVTIIVVLREENHALRTRLSASPYTIDGITVSHDRVSPYGVSPSPASATGVNA